MEGHEETRHFALVVDLKTGDREVNNGTSLGESDGSGRRGVVVPEAAFVGITVAEDFEMGAATGVGGGSVDHLLDAIGGGVGCSVAGGDIFGEGLEERIVGVGLDV